MARIIVTIIHYLFSIFSILCGALFLYAFPVLEAPGFPMWHFALEFSFGSGCILLGFLSWKRARRFESTGRAFFYLFLRTVTFLFSFFCLGISISSLKENYAESAIFAPVALIFFGVTILLTLANKFKSANTGYLIPAGKDTSARIDYLTLAGKAKFAKRLANQQDGRYVIDPRDFRKDRIGIGFMVVFWLIWAPATVFVTCLAYDDPEPFYFLWLVFGYLGTIIIPVSLFRMNKKQVLEVAGDSLVVDTLAIIPPFKVRIDKLDLQALTLERYQAHSRHGDTVFTLSLVRKGNLWPKRIPLAHGVKLEDQAIIFEEIKEFLKTNGFVFEARNDSTGLRLFNKVPGH